jgi:TatD DNase family protein
MQLVDSHCHLNLMPSDISIDTVIENAINNGIFRIMVPGIDIQTSLKAIQLAEKYEIVYAAVGIHPNEANTWSEENFKILEELSQHPKVKAIGEIGLDFYRETASPAIQKQVFTEQLNLSEFSGLPVIIHSRNAINEVNNLLVDWNIISEKNFDKPFGVLHSFEGNKLQADQMTKNNYLIGIGGPVTYKNAIEKHEIARCFTSDSIVLETDSPFLAPHPHRGKVNEPAYIKFIAERIANLSEKPLKWIAQETSKNANNLFAWEQ